MYDIDKLIEASNSLDVAEAIGLPIKRSGRNIFCECPSHRKVLGKDDNNISNCVLTPHGYTCFSCGAKGTVLQMVMDYCNVPFPKALDIVAGVTGGNFRISNEIPQKRQPFNAEDLDLIGVTSVANPEGNAGKEIIGVTKIRPDSKVFFRKGDESVLYSSVKRITLNQLFTEDESLYFEIIEESAKAALEKYQKLFDCFNDRNREIFQRVYDILAVEGEINGSLVAEIKNVLLLNIKKVKNILNQCRKEN